MLQDDLAKKFQDLKGVAQHVDELELLVRNRQIRIRIAKSRPKSNPKFIHRLGEGHPAPRFQRRVLSQPKNTIAFPKFGRWTIRKAHPRRAPCDVESFVFKDERRGSKWIPLLLL